MLQRVFFCSSCYSRSAVVCGIDYQCYLLHSCYETVILWLFPFSFCQGWQAKDVQGSSDQGKEFVFSENFSVIKKVYIYIYIYMYGHALLFKSFFYYYLLLLSFNKSILHQLKVTVKMNKFHVTFEFRRFFSSKSANWNDFERSCDTRLE